MDLAGRVAVITGGGSGMGFAAARALAAKGAKVALFGRRRDLVAQKAEELGGIGLACDISDEASVEAALDEVQSRLGTPSILINSAGDARMFNLVSPAGVPADGDAIRAIIATNVLGTLYMARGFAMRLSREKAGADGLRGLLINVSSAGAADSVMGSTYCASKGAVDAVGLSLAREFSIWGIRVVTIAPGGIETELFRAGAVEGTYDVMKTMVPSLRRPGRPEEFGRLALHICENDYLNGTVIRLDGGLRIPFSFDIGGGVEGPDSSGETA